jgi:hypothetical protein
METTEMFDHRLRLQALEQAVAIHHPMVSGRHLIEDSKIVATASAFEAFLRGPEKGTTPET